MPRTAVSSRSAAGARTLAGARSAVSSRTAVDGGGGLGYTNNLYAWYKADAIVGLNDNDPVGTWADSSGNNRDITQGTADNKPLYKTGILNSLPAVRFDGSNDFLKASAWNLSQPFAYFFVLKSLDVDGASQFLYENIGARGDIFRESGGTYTNWGAQQTLSSTANLFATFKYYTHIINGASSNFRFSGGNDVTHSPGTNALGTFVMATENWGGYQPNLDICEWLIYNEAISDTNRNTVESYLATKYGL